MPIKSTIVSVPRVTEAEADAAKLKLGRLARFSTIPVIDSESAAIFHGMLVAANRCVEQELGGVSEVEKIEYDEAAAQWNITYGIA